MNQRSKRFVQRATTARYLPVLVAVVPVVVAGSPFASAEESSRDVSSEMPQLDLGTRPDEARFRGGHPTIRWGQPSPLHFVSVETIAEVPRVVYRSWGETIRQGTVVSPANLSVREHGEMPPTIEVLPDQSLVVTYVVSLPGFRRSALNFQRSADAGSSWGEPVLVHDDGMQGGHSFFSTTCDSEGQLHFAWLDRRSGQQGLVTATSSDGVIMNRNQSVDPETCQCCGTAVLSGPDGAVWIAYRELARDGDQRDVRDIALIRSQDGGSTFGPPTMISNDQWVINGCPHTGPRLALGANQTLWATWFTGAPTGVYLAHSTNGGRTFARRERVGDGRHPEVTTLPDGQVLVLFEQKVNGQTGIVARLRKPDRLAWSEPMLVTPRGHHPRAAVSGNELALVYSTESDDGTPEVQARRWRFPTEPHKDTERSEVPEPSRRR